MKNIYLLFVGFLLSFNSQGQISQIIEPLMFGGKIRTVAQNANCVLVATDGGIFKTTNDGLNWTNATNTFNPKTVSCDQIVSIGNNFYAQSNTSHGPAIYKSNDDGVNWSQLKFTNWSPQTLGKLSNTLYVVGNDNMSGGRLYSSSDGSNWTPKAILWTTQWQGGNCKLYAFNPDKLYLLLNNNLYYTTDGSMMITISLSGLANTTSFNGDNDIDGDAAGNLYFITNNSIYKYNFVTEVWSDISTGKIPIDYQILNLSVTNNAIFCTTMTPSADIKLYRSTNLGQTFDNLNYTGLSVPMIDRVNQVSTQGMIGNDLNGSILISANSGDSWTSNNGQFIASYSGNLTKSGNSLLFSTENRGFIRSTNQGLNWSINNVGVPDFGGIAYFVEQLMVVKDTLFSFLRPAPFSKEVTLYKSGNNGDSWQSIPIPAPYSSGENYSFSGVCDSAIFVNYYDLSSSSYALIVTFKNGTSWVKPNSQNNSQQTYLKGSRNCLFAFFATPNSGWQDFTNIYKANNFGMSFTDINPNTLFGNNVMIKRLSDTRGDKGGPILDFDSQSNIAIFAVNDRRMGTDIDKLYKYDINANLWLEIPTVGLPQSYIINFIKYTENNVWLLATNFGLYKSVNGGVTWSMTHNVIDWQQGVIVNSIEIFGNKAFLGTMANGVWVSDLSSSIIENSVDKGLQIFPNPASASVNIRVPDVYGNSMTVSLYSIEGKLALRKNVKNSSLQLDISKLALGSYFVVIESNHHIYRKAIIHK